MISLEEIAPIPDVPGVAVSLADRAKHLGFALDAIGEARKLEGFAKATEEESMHRRPIEERYGDSLATVQRGVARHENAAWRSAEFQFAYGTGHIALKRSGLMPTEQANALARDDFNAFEKRYFIGDDAQKMRAQMRRRLKRQAQQP